MSAPPIKLINLCLLVSLCSNWQFGYQISYVNTAADSFYKLFNTAWMREHNTTIPAEVWTSQWSITVSSFYPGAILGFLLIPFGVKKVGLKWSYVISSVPAVFGCIIQFFAILAVDRAGTGVPGDQEAAFFLLLVVGRILVGIHGGAAMALLPLWIREVSPPPHRGMLSAFQNLAQAATTLVGLLAGLHSAADLRGNFELLQAIALIPTLLLVIIMYFIPQTPHHYFHLHPDLPKGAQSILFYYGPVADLRAVTQAIEKEWSHANNVVTSSYSLKALFMPRVYEGVLIRKGFLLGLVAAASYAFTADDLIDSFSSDLLEDVGSTERDLAKISSIIMGVILLITSIIGCWLVEKLGRKMTLVGGLVGTAVTNLVAVIFISINPRNIHYKIACTIAFCFTKAFIGSGAGAPAWFLTSELVPPEARTLAQTISTATLLAMNGVLSFVYEFLQEVIGANSLVVLCCIPALICAIVLALLLPETKEKDIDEILTELDKRRMSNLWKLFRKIQKRRKYGTLENERDNTEVDASQNRPTIIQRNIKTPESVESSNL